MCDPPCAVADAMRRSVRLNRLHAVAQQIPGLIPHRTETGTGRADNGYVLIDFARVLSNLAAGTIAELKDTPEWERKHAPFLPSAAAGGQWTQSKRAAVKKWCITDNRCQLCLIAPGTVVHRRRCRRIRPTNGWSAIPGKAQLAANKIGARRLDILRDAGMLTLELPPLPDKF